MVTVRVVDLVLLDNLVWLPTAVLLESYTSIYKPYEEFSVSNSMYRYCVLAVAVNLNHCEPFTGILPSVHVLAVSEVAKDGIVTLGGDVDALNAIW
jgi:hypothetical protein